MDLILYVIFTPLVCYILFILYLIVDYWYWKYKEAKYIKARLRLNKKIKAGKYSGESKYHDELLKEEFRKAYLKHYGKRFSE